MAGAGPAMAAFGGFFGAVLEQEQDNAKSQMIKDQIDGYKLEAAEIREREAINIKALEQQGRELEGFQQAGAGGANVAVGGSYLMFMESQQAKIRDEILIVQKEANYQVNERERQQTILAGERRDMQRTQPLRMFSRILGGAGQAASMSANSQSRENEMMEYRGAKNG